jgi:DUF1680 family protein
MLRGFDTEGELMDRQGVRLKVTDRFQHIDASELMLGGEFGRRIEASIYNNLFKLDWEGDFLHLFRSRNANVSTYVGLGKVIDSAVRFAHHTRSPAVVDWKDTVIGELLKTQDSDGYIGTFPLDLRMWYVWDVHEMSYIVMGLTSDYLCFGDDRSLEAARNLMDYMILQWQRYPGREIGGENLSYWLVATGLEQAVLGLYRITRDRRYLEFCIINRELPQWNEPIVVGRHGRIEGHVYGYLARCLAQQELFRILGDETFLEPSRNVLDFVTQKDGMAISGACGQSECWNDRQDVDGHLGETCASAHFVYFLDSLLRLEADAYYGDLMERIIYNTLFAAQSPDGRRLRYYTPLEGVRRYFGRDAYCCPGNYRRIIADLPTVVYYRTAGGLAVNLYTPSKLTTRLEAGPRVTLEQQTDYPGSGEVVLTVNPARTTHFPLKLRIPAWCRQASVRINAGEVSSTASGGAFLTLEREWSPGDTVHLSMPMEWRAVRGRANQSGRVAIMRGPLLYCVNPDLNGGAQSVESSPVLVAASSIQDPLRVTVSGVEFDACRVRAWTSTGSAGAAAETEFLLTAFPDPGGTATYFAAQDPTDDIIVDDELLSPRER